MLPLTNAETNANYLIQNKCSKSFMEGFIEYIMIYKDENCNVNASTRNILRCNDSYVFL